MHKTASVWGLVGKRLKIAFNCFPAKPQTLKLKTQHFLADFFNFLEGSALILFIFYSLRVGHIPVSLALGLCSKWFWVQSLSFRICMPDLHFRSN
jgi:hypothetical protein